MNWAQFRAAFIKEVRRWVGTSPSPEQLLKQVESRMLHLNAAPQDEPTIEEIKVLQKEHRKCLEILEYYWHQRSRVKWAIFGDGNTRFFQASTRIRNRRNTIRALQLDNSEWVTNDKDIRRAFVTHFKGIYTSRARAKVQDIYPHQVLASLPKIPDFMHESLQAAPTDLEIKAAAMALGPYKAPGPEGFSAKVVQDNWASFGLVIIKEVGDFFRTGQMKQGVARSNVVLIPKKEEPSRLTYYRPISVCNLIYKIVSKILTTRIRPFMPDCISTS